MGESPSSWTSVELLRQLVCIPLTGGKNGMLTLLRSSFRDTSTGSCYEDGVRPGSGRDRPYSIQQQPSGIQEGSRRIATRLACRGPDHGQIRIRHHRYFVLAGSSTTLTGSSATLTTIMSRSQSTDSRPSFSRAVGGQGGVLASPLFGPLVKLVVYFYCERYLSRDFAAYPLACDASLATNLEPYFGA